MSIQIVEIAQPSVIDTVAVAQPSTVAVVEIRQGPAGAGGGGSATWGSITGTLSAQTDLQTALNLKAPLASPALTGTPTAPTAATTTNTTQLASTAFVQQELASGVAVAKNLEFLARNQSGALITKGSIVYINGATGNKPLITLAQANSDENSAQTIGFAKTDIADNGTGFVIVRGELENVKTFGATEGQQLYLSPTTAGAFTTTKPSAPEHLVYVGIVIAASTGAAFNGIILVAIQNGYELSEIHDVSITAPVAAGQVIKRNAGNTLWINSAIVSADVSDATSTTSNGNLALRDPDHGTLEAAAFIATDANDGTSLKGLSTLGNVTLAPNDSVYDNLTFGFLNYTYGAGSAAAHRTALGSGATGDALFTAATPAAARTTILNEILKYDANAAASRTNPATQANDDTLVGINLTAGMWEFDFSFSFDAGACGVAPRFLFGTIASVDLIDSQVIGGVFRGNQAIASLVFRTTTGTITPAGNGASTNVRYSGFWTMNITGNTTLDMQFARNADSAGTTIIRRAGAFLRARKING